MRSLLSNLLVLCFLSEVCVRSHDSGDSTPTKEDEWTALLNWFREVRSKENHSEWGFEFGGSSEEELDVTLEDEAPKGILLDKEEEWNRLINPPLRTTPAPFDLDEEQPIRGASLAFVFDSTGSMMEDLNQVKSGAAKILAALRDHPDAPIYNYIWVPFNDPDIGPITVTRDAKYFQQRMQELIVNGGGDCPEMSIGAIKKAIEVSLPNSYVYVFTDASSKDHRLLNDVLSLVQQKQAQVVFILTGYCGDHTDRGYVAYERIAETSSGQIYHLKRNEVKEVLKYVKVALQPHVVSLLSLKKPAPDKATPDKLEVVVDESLKQITVSVSGANATINVTDPSGVNIDGPPKLEKVLNLDNIKVVNVKEPDPGSWAVFVNSDSNYTVRSTGLSKVNFQHGFSTVETVNLKETNYRPLKGAKSFILIQTSDSEKIHNITAVDFVNLSGDIIQHVEMTPVPGMPGLFKGGGFVPPPEFYLGVTGFGQDGLPVKRITSTAIIPQLPEKPIISLKKSAVGWVGNNGTLKCYVQSVVPFSVRWYKNGVFVGREQNCSETCEVLLNIEGMTLQSEGNYSCSAKNVAGADKKTLSLTIMGEPPVVNVSTPVVVSLGERVSMDCVVDSKLPFVVKWKQFTARNQISGILHPVATGLQLENNSLVIESVKAEDEGWYVCTAANKGGESQGRVLLVVKEPLMVKVEPKSLTFVEGDSARFICSASGKPPPRLEWFKDQQKIMDEDPSMFVQEINGKLNLVIDYLEKRNAGVYLCNAANAGELASATAELIYTEKPTVKAKENNLMVKTGTEVVLQCSATGYPKPTITWLKREEEIVDGPGFQVEEDTLKIESAQSWNGGEYSCVARNSLGSDVDYIGLIVGSPPSFLQKPRDRKIQLNHNGTVSCSAIGVPPPEVKWKRTDGKILDSSRMSILSGGALKITRMTVEDAGQYNCTAENVFGSISSQVSIKVTGIEKPLPDKNVELKNVEALSGSELIIPCGILLGNPPAKVKWFKNGVQLEENSHIIIEKSGNLVLRNTSAADRGSYVCTAQNAAGNSSRPYEVLISESPSIRDTKETGLKGTVGGEIVIPCPVEGFPLPTVIWTRNSLPLPMSSTIFQDEMGSLIIRNLTEDNAGVYVCTAINAVGSASKTTSIQVQVPPVFPEDIQDSPVNVVEGHVVVLNCNVTAVPEPTIHWFKNQERLLQNGNPPKILRFVANVDDTGLFKCVVENEAGSTSREFNVTILVPPKILGRHNEESIKTKAGSPITLLCNVFGVPTPTILWQRNGMYLTQNSSEVTISDSGSLTIQNVTKESAGAYTCDAENLGGITQRNFYLQVNYPPKIIEEKNSSGVITLKEGEEYSLACLVEGNPKPVVLWRKNGLPIHGQHHDMIVLEDNTLVFLQVTRETTGVYKCEAISPEGNAFKEYEVKVIIPPLLSDFYPTRLEVNEGDSLALTCPTSSSDPPPNIQWIKDGEPLDLLLQERSDEAQMKLSPDQRTLTIVEAHPSDRGNYSCVATNLAGRTDARFLVDVLMIPHFEEFNHVAHRTILTGGEVVLNCSVSGNPQPKVTWRKENTPITPYNTPGVHVSLDKQHLVITNGKVHHTGTYICLATNKVNAKEREFYVTVLEPPQISGALQQIIDVMKGDNVTLQCQGSGVPPPTFTWAKEDNAKKLLNVTEDSLTIVNASCYHSGIYLCDVTNTAGTRTKYFQLNVLERPQIENQELVDEVTGVLGGNLTMKCKTSGSPKPEITWLHNGHILKNVRKRQVVGEKYWGDWEFTEDGLVSLTLRNLREQNRGTYTLLASNKAGVVEKNFSVRILVPPRVVEGHKGIRNLTVVQPLPIVLKCPVVGDPVPWILWFYGDVNGEVMREGGEVVVHGTELRIKESSGKHAGVYACLAENPGGQSSYRFNVSVIEPPKVEEHQKTSLNLLVNDTLTLHCNSTGDGELKRSWFHFSTNLKNSSDVSIISNGNIMVMERIQLKNSGVYSCVTTNIAGSVETLYQVDVYEPPALNDQSSPVERKVVQLHRPFSLYCFTTGYPPPEITWYKNGKIFETNHSKNSILSDNSYLTFATGTPEDVGDYKCVAKNKVGIRETNFRVDVVVSGEWIQWSAWSPCTVSCGLGEEIRQRTCNVDKMTLDPRLKVDKSKCAGEAIGRRNCFRDCPVDGGWGSWGSWTACSVTCGQGIRRRSRQCDNPKPENNGQICIGADTMEETCFDGGCPVNGQWSEWSPWSECSDPCDGGVTQRMRKCDSPPPQNGGNDCPGWSTELKVCNRKKCLDNRKWLPWSEWSPCSETCGKGFRKRYRACKLTPFGGKCKGKNLEIEKCFIRSCANDIFPSSANLYVKGNLNGNPIDDRLDVSIKNLTQKGEISVNMKDLLKKEKEWFPYTPFLLSPLSWNAAHETDDADNGYSLTKGQFFSQSDIKFATGEELKVNHKGDGVDKNGSLVVEIEVIGEVPLAKPYSSVIVKPFDQDFVQTGSNSLYSSSRSNVTIENRDVPYSWNSSIQYDSSKGTMPYLVEKLSMKEISHDYNPETQKVSFSATSTIGKKFEDDRCPLGFVHQPNLMHCEDVNECDLNKNLCQRDELCENTFGSYKCVCRSGFRATENGCEDIDECSRRQHSCSHFCHNTLGSYKCSCPPGFYLIYDLRTCVEMSDNPGDIFYDTDDVEFTSENNSPVGYPDALSHYDYDNYDRLREYKATPSTACPPGYFFLRNECRDYNECEDNSNICDKDELCINLPGSFQCLSIPCPIGYQRLSKKEICIRRCASDNKCRRGASLSESLIFHSLTLNSSNPSILDLEGMGEPQCNVVKTTYKVTESNKIFEIRVDTGVTLHATRKLNKDTLYRVKIEAFSYNQNHALLYFTEFVIFIVIA